ncbi:MAG: IPT/TIG domain-containing protein [Acidimicrobiales bacterium]
MRAFGSASQRRRTTLVSVFALAVLVVPIAVIQAASVDWSAASSTPPKVTSLSRATGPVEGGTKVTITGTGFTGTTIVQFGSTVAQSFSVRSTTQVVAVAPAEAAGTAPITVTTFNGPSEATPADVYKYVYPVPSVTEISPPNGPPSGGTTLTFSGSGLTGATSVNFGTDAVLPNSVNATGTQLTVTSPGGAPPGATIFVNVTTPGGRSNTVDFVFGPIVISLSRTSGPTAGGNRVTITGSLFTGVTNVKFGTATAKWTVNSSTSITAITPAHSAGSVPVVVTTSGDGTSWGTAQGYTYV